MKEELLDQTMFRDLYATPDQDLRLQTKGFRNNRWRVRLRSFSYLIRIPEVAPLPSAVERMKNPPLKKGLTLNLDYPWMSHRKRGGNLDFWSYDVIN